MSSKQVLLPESPSSWKQFPKKTFKMATLNDDDIVISGVSGKYPESENVEELWDNLIKHVNMVTVDDRRWNPGFFMNSHNIGKFKDIKKIDVDHFGILKKNRSVKFMGRSWALMFEHIYGAIIDSGRSKENISNSRTCVIVATSNTSDLEVGKWLFANDHSASLDHLTSYAANVVSYILNLKGESIVINAACSSGLVGIETAIKYLEMGKCDYAIVATSQLAMLPFNFLSLEQTGKQSSTGACRSFDEAADGYVRSDAVVVCFLEKARTAKRVYCTALSCLSNSNGFQAEGIAVPSKEMQINLYEETIKNRVGINQLDITYVEADGTGVVTSDVTEISSLSEVYCKDRLEPLLIGSIKSNMGHSELSSGLCSLTKAILIMEKGIIPANINFKKPNSKIPALKNGQIKVVSANTPWTTGLIAINSFGIGGTNAHLILRANLKEKSVDPVEKKRKLFAFTSGTKEGLEVMMDYLENNPDPNLYALLSSSMENPDPNMFWKGYTILNSKAKVRKTELFKHEKRPVCFVFSGFGCQWIGMGRDLMQIDVFRESLEKSYECLKEIVGDINSLMENQEKVATGSMSWQAVTLITAIQIALTDLLRILEINPDYIIGYSTGETACAYADGCITREQAMLLSYHKGLAIVTKNSRNGMMAVATLSPKEANENLPPGVTVACHNAEDSVTLAGEAEAMAKYLQHLRSKNVNVKKFDSNGFAFHCKALNQANEELLKECSKIIPYPKPRSSKWISTSIPEKDWGSDLAKTFSAEYLTNNFEEPVLFYEGLQHIPKNSIFIEISSHNILTPLLKRTAGMDAKYITFMKKNADNVNVMLSNIGELYLAGLKPKISKLYPSVSFPVPRGTPMISSLLRSNYTDHRPSFTMQDAVDSGLGSIFEVELLKGSFSFIIDHNINGQIFFPTAGFLFLGWHQFAMHNFSNFDKIPVVFENVRFLKEVLVTKTGVEYLKTRYLKKSGTFEIYHNEAVCVVGRVRSPKLNAEYMEVDLSDLDVNEQMISKEDIYKEFKLLGYNYGKQFQGLVNINVDGTVGKIRWTDNWITFIESMLQVPLLTSNPQEPLLPTRIDYLYIDPSKHREYIATCHNAEVPVKMHPYDRKIQAGGIIGFGPLGTKIPKAAEKQKPMLEEYKFLPYFDNRCLACLTPLEDELKQYSNVCEDYIKRIIKLVKKVPHDILLKYHLDSDCLKDIEVIKTAEQRFLDNYQFKPYLLQHLKCSLESAQEASKEFLVPDLNNVEDGDFLLSAFLNDLILRATLDVAIENITSLTVNIIQISSPNVWLTKHLKSLLQSYSDRKTNYRVADSNNILADNKTLAKMNLEFLNWDVTSTSWNNTDIIIGYHTLSRNKKNLRSILTNIKNSLSEGGFALLIEPKQDSIIGYFLNDFQNTTSLQLKQKDIMNSCKALDLEIVAKKSDSFVHEVYLLRKVSSTDVPAIPIALEDNNFEKWVPQIQNSLKNFQNTDVKGNIWLMARNHPTSGIIGLAKSLAKEPLYGDRIRCLFEIRKGKSQTAQNQEIPKDIVKKDLLVNICQNGQWGSLRNIRIERDFKIPLAHAVLRLEKPGDLKSLYWCQSDVDEQLKSNQSKCIYVYYAGLCHLDVLSAKRMQGCPGFGYDFSGRNTEGTRIMGISVSSTLATCITCESKYTWTVPGHWTLAEAATVPLPYTLVYFALGVKGNLNFGEKVLIHCGTGAVGQAALKIALSMSCEIYVTVGSEEKKKFLKSQFPALKEKNILRHSTDLGFESQVMKRTKGKGVDVVLYSLMEDTMLASLRCLSKNGRFLNISNSSLPSDRNLEIFLRKKEYFDVRFESLFENDFYFQEVGKMITLGLNSGIITPINSTVFDKENVEDAFLLMEQNHIGKVVVMIRKEEFLNQRCLPHNLTVPTVPKVIFPANSTIIIVGGLSGFGMELTQWLVNRGARNLVLNSRSGIKNGYQERCVHKCRKSGVNVQISNQSLLDEDCVVDLVKKANDMAPVIGIFNAAVILQNDLMPKQTPESFGRVTDVKIKITRNLDKISRNCCPHLKYFVMFSSTAARGSPSQSNYAYGNAAMERICELRRDAGLPGLAIQWGLIEDDTFEMKGHIPQKVSSYLATLDAVLSRKSAVIASYVAAKQSDKRHEIQNSVS